MTRFNKVTIIGVGLIGGSIGLAIKRKRLASEVTGVFRRMVTLSKALKRRAVDNGVMAIADGVKDADLIIIASPVQMIPRLAAEAIRCAKAGAIITDAGSTKGWIVSEVQKIARNRPDIRFVGSHPMAGSERTGVESARADLFDGSACIVTRTPRTSGAALAKVAGFWRSLGLRVKIMSPVEHDRTVSLISHLPHAAAFALAEAVPGREMACAAEGFRDTTRVASSDPDLWADIFLTNRKAVADAGRAFSRIFTGLVKAVSRGDRRATLKILKSAKSKRDWFIRSYGR